MKYYVILLFVSAVAFTSCEHTKHIYKPNKFPSPFEYAVKDSAGGGRSELFTRADGWLTKKPKRQPKNYINNFTVSSEDQGAGKITAKGKFDFVTKKILVMKFHEYITYDINITLQDGRYTCTFSNFVHQSKGVKNGSSYKHEKPSYFDYSMGNLTQLDPTKSADKKRWDKIKKQSDYNAKKIMRSFKNAMNH